MQSLYGGVALFLKKNYIRQSFVLPSHIYWYGHRKTQQSLLSEGFLLREEELREVRNLLINIFILSNQSHTQPLNSQDTSILGKQNLFPIQNFSIASSSVTFIEGTLLLFFWIGPTSEDHICLFCSSSIFFKQRGKVENFHSLPFRKVKKPIVLYLFILSLVLLSLHVTSSY